MTTTDPSSFYTRLTTLDDNDALTVPIESDRIFNTLVRDVLSESYPAVDISYNISTGLRATADNIGPAERFELDHTAFNREDDRFELTVEAVYEDTLPSTRPSRTAQPVSPQDYVPVVVVYQLTGHSAPEADNLYADIHVFPGELTDFDPLDEPMDGSE